MNDRKLLEVVARIVKAETRSRKDKLADIDERLMRVEDHVGGMETKHADVEARLGDMENPAGRTQSASESEGLNALRGRIATLEYVVSDHLKRD